MNRKNRFVVLFSMAVVLALLAACGAPGPTATMVPTPEPAVVPTDTPPAPAEADARITVIFNGHTCAYEGPDKVPAGRISVILDVEDQKEHGAYGLAVLTLVEGKTFEDLDAWPSTDQPPWTKLHGLLHDILQGRRAETTVIASEGPLFVVCFTGYPVTKRDTLGPIEIEPLASR
jgi:hypothetical protein